MAALAILVLLNIASQPAVQHASPRVQRVYLCAFLANQGTRHLKLTLNAPCVVRARSDTMDLHAHMQ